MLLTQGSWDEARDRLIAYIEHKTDLTRPDEITEKTRIKGITELLKYSNVRIRFPRLVPVTWVFYRYVRGILCEDFRAKG